MTDGKREILGERDVEVVRSGESATARLTWWQEAREPKPRYGVVVDGPFGRVEAEGPDLFEALVLARRRFEPDGWLIAVQGARRDTFPSPMMRDMGGGEVVYVLRPGEPATRDDLVKTFDDAPSGLLATVDEQQRHIDEMP